ncbi:heterokaryon incompatibility protein-domain-containing protein [Xylaria sp. FL1777]|nr:heterokaryon incompatibility protein-domain-containing protein [Xylaria sp. FL1777]
MGFELLGIGLFAFKLFALLVEQQASKRITMRLINASKVVNDFKIEFNTRLHEENEDYEGSDLSDNVKLKYAILSHTWGWQDENTSKWAHKVDEVTYNDHHSFSNPFHESLHPDKQRAYQKIYHTCRRALDLGCDYVWIDSCCIDKSNSAELTESINSMFRWYSEAAVCLVYLVDSSNAAVESSNGTLDPRRSLYTKDHEPCRWFSRCWTLQELLASPRLEFYDGEWNLIGTMQDERSSDLNDFGNEISKITTVDAAALLCRAPLWEYSVEAKMSWASSRKSGRPEDMAYSLLGIFGIHMPLIYGEGAKAAFERLQLEISKSTPDLSLFAWHTGKPGMEGQFCSILADSPSQFRYHRRICRSIPESHHNMTNKGIQMTSIVYRVLTKNVERYFLCLEDRGGQRNAIGIFLRKIGYDVFQRTDECLTEIENLKSHPSAHRSTIYITTSSRQHDPSPHRYKDGSIHVPPRYLVYDVVPEAAWDCENRILLGSIPCSDGIRALKVGVVKYGAQITIGLVFRSSDIIAFGCHHHTGISQKLFTRVHRRSLMDWGELLGNIPELRSFSSRLDIPDVISLRVEIVSSPPYQSQLLLVVAPPLRLKASSDYPLDQDKTTGEVLATNLLGMASQIQTGAHASFRQAVFSNMSLENTSYHVSVHSHEAGRETVYMAGPTPRGRAEWLLYEDVQRALI